jgi:hypothetical protein
MKLKESHIDGKGKNYIKDVDKSGKDNNDLCDELTINSVKELRRKMRGMDISKKDKVKINNYIKKMNKTNKKLSVDLDVNNTYLRYIQNMLCTYSSEDKNNIDEMKVIKLKESDIKRIVKRVITENYGYDEYIPNIQLGDIFRDTFNGDIFKVTVIQHNNPDGGGEDYETWVELENKGGEVVSFPHDYEKGARFNDLFTKVRLKPKYNYPPVDDIQLNEQKQYSDDDYDYSFYKGVNASKIERELKDIISEKLKIRKTDLYNKNPHLEEDIKRLAQRIMSDVYSNVISYLSENYEGEIENIINGEFE